MQFRLRSAAALTAAAVIVLGAAVSQPAVAADDPASTVSDAVLEWGINPLQQIATPNGACNYFTAGVTNGKEESYAAQAGNVRIIKRLASGATLPAEKATRCDATAGSEIGQRGVFSEGTGVFDRAAGTASLSWTGSLTINSYGGLVPWHLTNPKLVVADGKARLSATIGGVASDMSNPTNSAPIPDTADQTILQLSGVQLTDEGITGTPVFDNVDYFPLNDPADANSGRHATSAVPDTAKTARWGAWPQDLVDFHYRTGLTSYWHSLAAGDAARKGPLGISIRFSAGETTTPEVTPISITQQPTRTEAVPGDDVTFTVRATGAQSYQWQYRTGWDGTWADIAGETGTSITITGAQTTNTGHYRVVLSNADIPRVESRQAELTVKPAESLTQMNGQKSLTVFEGGRMWLVTGFTGYPSPTFATQRSDDGGRTWVRLGTNDSMPFYEQAQADKSWDGSLFRVVASNRFEPAVAGKPIPVKVLPRPTAQTLIIDPNEHAADARFDQSVRNDISVMGAPFTKGKTVRFGVAPTEAWEAWAKNGTEIPESEFAWSAVVEESWNQFANGNFTRTARPDADTMKPGVSYSVVVVATDGTHDMDAAARIPLKGVADPEPETGGPGTGGPGTENPGTENPGTEGPKPGTDQPHVTNPNSGTTESGTGEHTQGSALASTGTEPSTPLVIGGGVLLLLGAALVTLRARRARS